MTSEQTKALIQALLRERDHYARHGKPDRVEQVDAQLAALGHAAKAPVKRAQKMTKVKGTEL